MNSIELIRYIVGPHRQGNLEFKSPYVGLLVEARLLTGRDSKTGNIVNKNSTGSWSGAIMYMILLDHIGGIFKNKFHQQTEYTNDFISALENFTQLSKKEIFALYALRCSFVHDFSLFNFPKENVRNAELLKHCFMVTRSSGTLVALPKKNWSGELKDLKVEVSTTIDLEELGNLVEGVHTKIIVMISENKIQLKISEEQMSVNYIGYHVSF